MAPGLEHKGEPTNSKQKSPDSLKNQFIPLPPSEDGIPSIENGERHISPRCKRRTDTKTIAVNSQMIINKTSLALRRFCRPQSINWLILPIRFIQLP